MQSKQAQNFHTNHLTPPSPTGDQKGSAASVNSSKHRSFGFDTKAQQAESEMRRDYIYEEYAIIAPKRHARPFDMRGGDHPLIETASSPHLNDQTAIDTLPSPLGGWPVVSVENKFPAISLSTPKAYGQQELVVDTPLSNTSPGQLSLESMQDVLHMYQRRIIALKKLDHIRYVQVFKNDGHRAGASLAHAHTQIFALPIIPPRFQIRGQAVAHYIQHKSSNPFDDIIAYERAQKQRVIADNDHVLAFCPYASGWPLEAWILPKRDMQSFSNAKPEELQQIAKVLLNLLRKLNGNGLNYNFFIEEGVVDGQRWVLKIYGRDTVSPLGGLEVSTGIMINTIPPEIAANWYTS